MAFKYHHIGIYSSNHSASQNLFYELMGHGKNSKEKLFGVDALMLTQKSCDLQLALYDKKPDNNWFDEGFGIKYVAFEVPDLEQALRQLQLNSVEFLEAPQSGLSFNYAVVKSIEGLAIVILQTKDDAPQSEPIYFTDNPFEISLTHTGVLTDDLAESEKFWQENFNLHRFSANYCCGSGFIALADAHWQPGEHAVFMEILCPPNVLNVDQYGYDLAGESFFHLGYYSNDVTTSWQYLVDKGMFPALPVYVEAGTAVEDSFVLGLDNVFFELFGGEQARLVMAQPDIRAVDEIFSVSAKDLAEVSGAMAVCPENHTIL